MIMDIPALWALARPIVQNQISIALAGVGTTLVASGAIDASEKASFVKIGTGIAMYVIPAAYTWWNDIGRARVLAFMAKTHAVAAPTATTGQAVKAATEAAKEAAK